MLGPSVYFFHKLKLGGKSITDPENFLLLHPPNKVTDDTLRELQEFTKAGQQVWVIPHWAWAGFKILTSGNLSRDIYVNTIKIWPGAMQMGVLQIEGRTNFHILNFYLNTIS